MDVKKLFNIILLALSLSTIFITLISYIIFKLRQARTQSFDQDKYKLEGTYFRRYAPELEKENLELKKQLASKSTDSKTRLVKFASLASFVFVVILTLLLLESFLEERKILNEKRTTAAEFRKLIGQGLFAKNEFNPYHRPVELEESIAAATQWQIDSFKNLLKNRDFCVLSTWRAKKFNQDFHQQALKRWISFFKRHNLNYTVQSKLQKKDCIWILPHINSFSAKEWSLFEKKLQSKHAMYLTGNSLSLNGVGKSKKPQRLSEKIQSNIKKEENIHGTLVRGSQKIPLHLPHGRLINWLPIDKNAAYVDASDSHAIVSKFDGSFFFDNKQRSRMKNHEKIIWSALDPISKEGIDQIYSDQIILSQMVSLVGGPIMNIHPLVAKTDTTISIILHVDEEKSQLEDHLTFFNELNISYSLASRSEKLTQIEDRLLLKNTSETLSILKDSGDFKEKSLKDIFDELQMERFELEEITKKKVYGHFPLNEKFHPKLLTALDLEKLLYIFGGKELLSYSPINLKNGDLLYLPRMYATSYQLVNNPLLVGEKDFYSNLESEYRKASALKSPYIMVISASSLSYKPYQKALVSFLEQQKKNITDLKKIIIGYRLAQNLQINYHFHNGQWKVKIINNNKVDMSEFSLNISFENKFKSINIDSLKSGEKYELFF